MPKKESFYAKTPAVPAKKLAGTNPRGSVTVVGGMTSPTVPKHMGIIHGLGPVTRQFGHPNVKGSHGYGHVARERHGHLRLSGSSSAHQLGKKKK